MNCVCEVHCAPDLTMTGPCVLLPGPGLAGDPDPTIRLQESTVLLSPGPRVSDVWWSRDVMTRTLYWRLTGFVSAPAPVSEVTTAMARVSALATL